MRAHRLKNQHNHLDDQNINQVLFSLKYLVMPVIDFLSHRKIKTHYKNHNNLKNNNKIMTWIL